MLQFRKHLKIKPPSRETEWESSPAYVRWALGWIVDHAMNNGMVGFRFGVNRETNEAWMTFQGPKWYRRPISWDMVPPPADSFPIMLQVCLTLADVETQIPIRRTIPARKGRQHISLNLTIDTIDSIALTWDLTYARDREDAETAIPDEASAT